MFLLTPYSVSDIAASQLNITQYFSQMGNIFIFILNQYKMKDPSLQEFNSGKLDQLNIRIDETAYRRVLNQKGQPTSNIFQ
jgi:hypothetical protein